MHAHNTVWRALALFGLVFPALAAPLSPSSHDMRNGHGAASGGSFNC